jgi:hypothetical protein
MYISGVKFAISLLFNDFLENNVIKKMMIDVNFAEIAKNYKNGIFNALNTTIYHFVMSFYTKYIFLGLNLLLAYYFMIFWKITS